MPAETKLKLTPSERRASVALAGLFAARMLGLFLLLPVFAVAARGLPGGDDPARVGLALGMYGLTQAFMQIPFGLASDRWGRRPVVIAGLLLFVAGSVVCAQASDVFWITIGRAIQGAGAISAAVTAWLADATRDEVRTRAMAMVGGSIGLSFAASLVLSPVLVGWWGLSGLFWTIACLGVVCLAVARWVVPVVPRTQARAMQAARPREVLLHPDLLRLNFGVFVLHLVQVALFVVAPALLAKAGGLDARELWKVYLPVILVSFVLMVPVVFVAEKRRAHRGALRAAVAGTGAGVRAAADGQPGFLWFRHRPDRLLWCSTCSKPCSRRWCRGWRRRPTRAWRWASTTRPRPPACSPAARWAAGWPRIRAPTRSSSRRRPWRCSGWPLPGRCGRWPSARGGGYARKSRNAPPSGANIRQIGGPQR